MSLLDQPEIDRVTATIAEVESHTDAELVAVLARRADDYLYIPTLWAAVIAILSPAVTLVTPFWLETSDVLLVQLAVFFVAVFIFRIPWLLRKLIPGHVKRHRAGNLARRMFLECNLHHTKGESGVLIFVSEAEHYVEIIADRGINAKVAPDAWQNIVDDFTAAMKRGEVSAGLIAMIEACGELLQQHVPATEEKNELPNHLLLI